MQPTDEMMTQAFLPAMRQLVAIQLRSEGLSQSRISSLLGTTQASVSLYLSASPDRAFSVLSKFSIDRRSAETKAAQLAEAVRSGPDRGVAVLFSIWTGLLGSGAACTFHRELYPSLADCRVCITELGSRGGLRSELIGDVADAVMVLEGSPEFVDVMPEVSVNIACAAVDAASPADVVAIPGRIVKVKDRAKAMLPPEAGVSAHMSRILLLARKKQSGIRACINLRYDNKMERVMRKLGLRILTIGSHPRSGEVDSTARALEERLRTRAGPFDAVVDEGGSGIEPNVYLFAKGAREVARLAVRVADAYSAA